MSGPFPFPSFNTRSVQNLRQCLRFWIHDFQSPPTYKPRMGLAFSSYVQVSLTNKQQTTITEKPHFMTKQTQQWLKPSSSSFFFEYHHLATTIPAFKNSASRAAGPTTEEPSGCESDDHRRDNEISTGSKAANILKENSHHIE